MLLPIPIFDKEDYFDEIELVRPKPFVIADTHKLTKTNFYQAIKYFVSGCCVGLAGSRETEDKAEIRRIIKYMPFRSIEMAAIEIVLLLDEDDGVEGIYPCPLCKKKIISRYIAGEDPDDPEMDTRDFIRDLHISYMEDRSKDFEISLNEPLVIKNASTGEELQRVDKIKMEYATIQHCINAYGKVGMSDEMRLQFAIYAESLQEINDKPVDDKWKRKNWKYLYEL